VAVEVREYTGPRSGLRHLFELAEDSSTELDSYIEEGRVLVAAEGDRILGHLQLTETAHPGQVEIKNMAVDAVHQRRGIGRALVEAAISLARDEGRSAIVVATATADTGNLRFYQRLGFRMLSIERDAFTADTGYEDGLESDGLALRDRVWLDLELA
jgi:GNAT superfamily N-acetyltransferase